MRRAPDAILPGSSSHREARTEAAARPQEAMVAASRRSRPTGSSSGFNGADNKITGSMFLAPAETTTATSVAHGSREIRRRTDRRSRRGDGVESVVSAAGSSKAKERARAARSRPPRR